MLCTSCLPNEEDSLFGGDSGLEVRREAKARNRDLRIIDRVVGTEDMAMNDLTKGILIQTEDITPEDTYMQEIRMMTSQPNWSTYRALGREGITTGGF